MQKTCDQDTFTYKMSGPDNFLEGNRGFHEMTYKSCSRFRRPCPTFSPGFFFFPQYFITLLFGVIIPMICRFTQFSKFILILERIQVLLMVVGHASQAMNKTIDLVGQSFSPEATYIWNLLYLLYLQSSRDDSTSTAWTGG